MERVMRVGKSQAEVKMPDPSIAELERDIALVRENINELIEQAAAYSGGGDENRNADRIAQQEQELARLVKLRDEVLKRSRG